MRKNAKHYLAEALILLMKDSSIEEITVSDIVKRAGVSRMTYYRYFSAKEELLEFYMNYIFTLYMEQEQSYGKEVPFGSRKHLCDTLNFFREYGDFAKCIYHSGNDGIMLRMVNKYMKMQPDFHKDNSVKRFAFYCYAGAIYNCYMEWVLEDFATPVEKLTGIICGLARP